MSMLVQNWMSKNVITVSTTDSMSRIAELMKEHNIRIVPVMKENKLVGVVTDGDIKRASASDATSLDIHELLYLIATIEARQVMTPDPVRVRPDLTLIEAAEIMLIKKISSLPVTDAKGDLIGIVTQSDLFRAMITLSGSGKKGIQIGFQVEDRAGAMEPVLAAVRSRGGRLVSIFTTHEHAAEGCRQAYLRFFGIDRSEMKAMLEDVGAHCRLQYVVDHQNNRRTVYPKGK
jgi:acetoin utilization protein AcuB